MSVSMERRSRGASTLQHVGGMRQGFDIISTPFDFVGNDKCYNRSFASKNSETQERISAQNQRIFKLLVSIVVLFSFCWLFAHVNHLISVLSLSKYCALRPAPVPLLFFWISHTNAAINSIIYFIFNRKFWQGLREVFRVRETIPLQTRHIQFSSQKFCIRRNGVCRKYRHHGNP